MTERVFVYGSLMYSGIRNVVVPSNKVVSALEIPDWTVVSRGGLPNFEQEPGSSTVGLIIEVSDYGLMELDRFEGLGSLYNRQRLFGYEDDNDEIAEAPWVYTLLRVNTPRDLEMTALMEARERGLEELGIA